MRWFLDMCVILYYIGEGDNTDLIKKTRKFVSNKNGKFLVCYYIKDINIPKWLKRQQILLREIIKKIKNQSYKLYSSTESSKLTERDKKKLMKIMILIKNTDNKEAIFKIERLLFEIERRINEFLKNYVDEFVIPVKEIDKELKSCLFTFIGIENTQKNDSDAKTISSAIQEHNKKELIILTSDKKDWNNELLKEVHNDIFLKKKYLKLPNIRYL